MMIEHILKKREEIVTNKLNKQSYYTFASNLLYFLESKESSNSL